jgi:hypothetical protein
MKSKVGRAAQCMSFAAIMSFVMVHQAFAYGSFTPPSTPPPSAPAVPEFDGPGALAAIALLVSLGIVFYNKLRK